MSQTMMRARVAAQGFTVFALLGGVILNMKKKNDQTALRRTEQFLRWGGVDDLPENLDSSTTQETELIFRT